MTFKKVLASVLAGTMLVSAFNTISFAKNSSAVTLAASGYKFVAAGTEADETVKYHAGDVLFSDDDAVATVHQDLKLRDITANPVTIGDNTYDHAIASVGDNTALSVDGGETQEKYRIAFGVTAKKDVTVKVDVKVDPGKTVYLLNSDTGSANSVATIATPKATEGGATQQTTLKANVKAGETVYFAGLGTNAYVYGVDASVAGEDDVESGSAVETSTEETTAAEESTEATTAAEESSEATTEAAPVVAGYDFVVDNEAIGDVSNVGDVLFTSDEAEVKANLPIVLKSPDDGNAVSIGENAYVKYLQSEAEDYTSVTFAGEDAVTKIRIAIAITAKKDMTLKVDNKIGSKKINYLIGNYDEAAATATVLDKYENTGSSSEFGTLTATVKAGETVYFAGKGTNPVFFAADFDASESSDVSTDASTETTTAEEVSTESTTDAQACDVVVAVDSISAKAGDTVEVPVRVTKQPGLATLGVYVAYDPALTLDQAKTAASDAKELFQAAGAGVTINADGNPVMYSSVTPEDAPSAAAAKLFSLYVTIPANAAAGTKFNIAPVYTGNASVEGAFDALYNQLTVGFVGGVITVEGTEVSTEASTQASTEATTSKVEPTSQATTQAVESSSQATTKSQATTSNTETTTSRRRSSGGGGGGSSSGRIVVNGRSSVATTEASTEATTSSVVDKADGNATGFTKDIKVTIDSNIVLIGDAEVEMDAAAYIQEESDSTLVPLRFVAIAITEGSVESVQQADSSEIVSWDADTKTATIKAMGKVVKFTAGSDIMVVGTDTRVMDNGVVAEITNDRMYVPFRALGNALGVKVEWDEATRTAIYLAKK